MINAFLNWVKATLVLEIKHLLVLILVSIFKDIIGLFDLVVFIFLDLNKFDFGPPLLITLIFLALSAIKADALSDPVIFSIKLSRMAILLKL